MDGRQLPKTLELFLTHIYKDFPVLKKHPDYNFYYLYLDEPQVTEYLICLVDDFLVNTSFANELHNTISFRATFYNFENATIMNFDDFTHLSNQVETMYNELKKTEKTILFYQVW